MIINRIDNILYEYKKLENLKILSKDDNNVTISKTVDAIASPDDDDLIIGMTEMYNELKEENNVPMEPIRIEIEISGKGLFKHDKLINFSIKDTKEFTIKFFSKENNLIKEYVTDYNGRLRIII